MKKQVFKVEFGRRVFRFVDSVLYFNSTGRVASLLPHLFQLISYVVYKDSESLFKEVDTDINDLDALCDCKSLIEVSIQLNRLRECKLHEYKTKMRDDDDDELPF